MVGEPAASYPVTQAGEGLAVNLMHAAAVQQLRDVVWGDAATG
jgi:hypothetical protein